MFRKCILVAIAAFVPTLGYSFQLTNCYLRGFVGPNFVSIPSIPEASLETNVGYAVGGSFGYKFSRTCRLEGELSYRNNSFDQLVFEGDAANIEVKLDGDLSSFGYMGNLIFDLPVNWTFVPYFGVGLGGYREWASASISALKGTPDEVRLEHRKEGVAYQLIAGLILLHYKTIDAGIEYHFFDSATDSDSDRNHTLAFTCRKTF